MAKKQKKKPISNYVLLGAIFLIIGVAWGIYQLMPRETASIFVVSTPLQMGQTTITGIIQKDTPMGELGNYFIVTDDDQIITLDSVNLDNLVGLRVEAEGDLQYTETGSPYLIDQSIKIVE